MPSEQIGINLSQLPAYEAGAVLFSVLAYPNEPDRRPHFHEALCHCAIKAASAERWNSIPVKPAYLEVPSNKAESEYKTGMRLLRDRLVAARIIIPYLREIETGNPSLIQGRRRSLNSLSQIVAEEIYLRDKVQRSNAGPDAKTIQKRIFRPSKPVLHIAAAIAVTANDIAPKAEGIELGAFLFSAENLRTTVNYSELFRAYLPQIPDFQMYEEATIQLVLC